MSSPNHFVFTKHDFEIFNTQVRSGKREKLEYKSWKLLHNKLKELPKNTVISVIKKTASDNEYFFDFYYHHKSKAITIEDFFLRIRNNSFASFLLSWWEEKAQLNGTIPKSDNMGTYYTTNTTSGSPLIYDGNNWTTTTVPNYIWNTGNATNAYTPSIQEEVKKIVDDYYNEKNNIIKEENKKMASMLPSFDFGPVKTGSTVRMSAYGLALKNKGDSFVAYDKENDCLMNVDIFNINGDNMFYKIPVALDKVSVGDIIVHNHTPMFVVEILKTGIKVVDPVSGERKEIMPARNMFGFNFVTKIISLFDGFGGVKATADNPFGNMLPFLMMKENSNGFDAKTMAMFMMMNKGEMDFSNPMMLMAMAGEKGNSDFITLMLMGNMMKTLPKENTQ